MQVGGGGKRIIALPRDRKSTRLNSSHSQISYAVFCLKKKNIYTQDHIAPRRLSANRRTARRAPTADPPPQPRPQHLDVSDAQPPSHDSQQRRPLDRL